MKLSRRGKFVRHSRHTKRAGNKLRYKSKKFRALKRYHRRGGRHTKKLYGRRVKKGGEVKFGNPITYGEGSESNYKYTLTGTITPELRYKKIGFSSFTSDTSTFDIEIIAVRNTKSDTYPITINITFTRKKLPKVTYTISSTELNNILVSISNPNVNIPKIMGVDEKKVEATYEFSFKENEVDFRTIQNKVKEIEIEMRRGIYSTIDKKKRVIEDKIKDDEDLQINIASWGQEAKNINYPTEIKKLQEKVDEFIKRNPNYHDIYRLKALMAEISKLLLQLLVEVYFYQNYDSNGQELKESEKRARSSNQDKRANLFISLQNQLYEICNSTPVNTTDYQNQVDDHYGFNDTSTPTQIVNNNNTGPLTSKQEELNQHHGVNLFDGDIEDPRDPRVRLF